MILRWVGLRLTQGMDASKRLENHILSSNALLVWLLSALFLVLGAIGALIATYAFRAEPLVPDTDIVDPFSFVVGVFVSFVGFLALLHVAAVWFARPKDKRLLHAIEYAYLILGLLGLVGVTSYGLERVNYFRDVYANAENTVREETRAKLERLQKKPSCSFIIGGDVNSFCRWLRRAKALTEQTPLRDGDVQSLFASGKRVVESIGDYDAQDRDIAEFIQTVDMTKAALDIVVERASVVEKLDDVIARTKFPSFFKLYAFYLLAFAMALRITKISLEMLGIVAK
jgi:hypothetical protein